MPPIKKSMFWQKNKPPAFTGGFLNKNLIKKKINIVAIMARQKTFILSSRDIPILYHSDYKKVYVLAENYSLTSLYSLISFAAS